MSEDRSLDEFGGGKEDAVIGTGPAGADPTKTESTDTESTKTESTDTDHVDAGDEGSEPADGGDSAVATKAEPATATATWTTGGAACDRCGERVERRWLDEGDRVCPNCKSW